MDRQLERAAVISAWPIGDPADGRLEASLVLRAARRHEPGSDGEPKAFRILLTPAQRDHPLAYRRPLAFYRLAKALGTHVVPAAAVRRVHLGTLAGWLDKNTSRTDLLQRLAVMNDGAVDVLLTAPAPGIPGPRWGAPRGRVLVFDEAPEIEAWAQWASSPTPAPGERPALLRDYIEVLALDYLAGHVLRRDVLLDDAEGALILESNDMAFPMHVKANALDRFLDRLKQAARFPRALRDALRRLGRDEAARSLAPGGFSDWLVPPRTLLELDERRAALLSLIEARIAARGEDAVLSL